MSTTKRKVTLPAWTPEELDRLSQIMPEDLVAGQAWVAKNAPKRLRLELKALPENAKSGNQ